MTPRIRVLVAEDSLTVRRRLCEVIGAQPEFALVGEAADGKQAIELCQRLRPDVVTMDMMMPVMSGLAATEFIMAHCPTPILVVSASLNRGEVFKTYEALAAGAVDVLDKPGADAADGEWETRLVSTLKLVARIRVITHPRARLGALGQTRPELPASAPPTHPAPLLLPARPPGSCEVLVIGASTGGPAAILDVLRSLRQPFPAPILFVLHIGEPFGMAFADWLDGQTGLRVAYARDGDTVAASTGRVVMAPPDAHLVIRQRRLRLTHDPMRHSCRPSVDVLFESVAREYGAGAVAVLLTGMGRDGAAGLLDIRRAGGFTIAQDEASSVVYGMPREAVLLDAVDRQLPLAEIGPTLSQIVAGPAAERWMP
jgi:two-component system, chemotaxis family, protein-glutamate methylesterase/glutaminase